MESEGFSRVHKSPPLFSVSKPDDSCHTGTYCFYKISISISIIGDISGSHGDEYEHDFLLGCCAVYSGRSLPTFQRCLHPLSSGRRVIVIFNIILLFKPGYPKRSFRSGFWSKLCMHFLSLRECLMPSKKIYNFRINSQSDQVRGCNLWKQGIQNLKSKSVLQRQYNAGLLV
jgi:hypothetical protein